jgi:hypothetical protein
VCQSNRDLWCPGPLRPAPIDAFEQHRKLRTRQTNSSFRSLRPDESSSLETLGKQTQAVTVPPQKFYDVTSAPSENEDVSGERLLFSTVCTFALRPSNFLSEPPERSSGQA